MKVIKSPVEKFPGTVGLYDHTNFPQLIAWQDAVINTDEDSVPAEKAFSYLKGIFALVEEWKLENVPEDVTLETFPSKPVTEVMKLISWLISEINVLFSGDDTDPNA